jgi:hypothetical protein
MNDKEMKFFNPAVVTLWRHNKSAKEQRKSKETLSVVGGSVESRTWYFKYR